MGHSRIPRCLFDTCTVFVGPKLTSGCHPPPWVFLDVADNIYNCTSGGNPDTPICIRGKTLGPHRRVLDGYNKYKAGKETIYVKEYTTKKTWDQAAQQCRSDGARLAVLDSRKKHNAIKRYYVDHWIGLRDMYDNDTFFWTDGSSLRFKAWHGPEPTHLNVKNMKENCGEIYKRAWNDCDCSRTQPFLCEQLF